MFSMPTALPAPWGAAFGATLQALGERLARRARIRATHEALQALDAHLLHDLGLDRSEIGSVAVEIADLGTPAFAERVIRRTWGV